MLQSFVISLFAGCHMQIYKQQFIEFMVNAGVLTFGDFTTKSGRKTPYFVNTGNYRTGAQIAALGDFYAACIEESGAQFDLLFGPAYKGIPLVVTSASALYRNHNKDYPYAFNRKEAKDHGEGGTIIGQAPKAGDKIAIIEDVVTAGTAVRETVSMFKQIVPVTFSALYVSVDRMERGTGTKTTIDELRDNLNLEVFPIVTVLEVMEYLHNREVSGKVHITDELLARMKAYLAEYGA